MYKLRAQSQRSESGVVVIIMAGGLILVLMFAGLAIDGSNAYLQHRRMQNAADAGALAGARLLARHDTTNQSVLSAVERYVEENGGNVSQIHVEYVDASSRIGKVASYGLDNSPPVSAVGVYVTPTIEYRLFLGGLFGISRKNSSAEAVARVGSTGSLDNNVFPVAVDDDLLATVDPGARIRIWNDDRITDANGNDLNSHRGWLNFNFIYSTDDPNSRTTDSNYSNSELKDWAGGNFSKTVKAGSIGGLDGDFINGDPGVRDSTVLESQARIGDVVYLPIYDTLYSRDFMMENMQPAPNGWWPGGGGGSAYYHIVGFAGFEITEVKHGGEKYIEGRFVNRAVEGPIDGALTAGESLVSVALSDVPPPSRTEASLSGGGGSDSSPIGAGGASGSG
ncbi:MAG: hypothetical protein AUJ92_13875 [Armatimonadetes bacterium CG2_30_59_28]|nr:hypothetical protein [Armatimonadota bacterium]OIO92570.1 MAG: hypothetical protein AUJ92_13875 [Armatimonadetes bacterium CG2_30_59_28]PIU60596.1 MAG: hypothetical protein COS85_23625 [Armatimonadetes bacterium CG07_land_8_20_14_0_80_59_28]PIX38515.1 MAG: hypothetical protein COZ56_20270 [Armatimonadetes bacterium CG_4_8_14_3_um_filter_58_9]PIY43185.1 MAG: hypothetical protein COZ05_11795 [Armatimonadetes bacterium CG_4_10_14_3_um_filter_59_10]